MFLRSTRLFAASVGMLFLVTGCSAPVAKSDPNLAKTILVQALDAWKDGKTVQDLQSLKPPIYVSDDLWSKNLKLAEYKLLKEGDFHETSVRFSVQLKIGSEPKTRTVQYWVSTNPAYSISLGE